MEVSTRQDDSSGVLEIFFFLDLADRMMGRGDFAITH